MLRLVAKEVTWSWKTVMALAVLLGPVTCGGSVSACMARLPLCDDGPIPTIAVIVMMGHLASGCLTCLGLALCYGRSSRAFWVFVALACYWWAVVGWAACLLFA